LRFKFILAPHLGKTVAELGSMTAAEEAHWIAEYRVNPWGEIRADMRAALVAQMVHNTNAKKPRKLQDFMLFREKPKGDSPQTIRENFERLIARQKS
jgi:hypothetical protein